MMKYFLAVVMTMFLASCANQELHDKDPTCDFDDGQINEEGDSVCTMDYKTKINGWQGKTITFHCENGIIIYAEAVKSSSCLEEDAQVKADYNVCISGGQESCKRKWSNECPTSHHITTENITCAPL